MRIRYLALIIILTVLIPPLKNTIIYAAEIKSTYDSVQEIKNNPEFVKLYQRVK